MIVAIHNQPYPIKQIIALQPSHAYISSFAQILGPLGWCEDGEAHAGIAVCPFGLFFCKVNLWHSFIFAFMGMLISQS